jgi:hypothetical protein
MEYLLFSQLTETDFDEVVLNAGGRRYTDDPTIKDLNCDYILDDAVIELKIIKEEPIEKRTKQKKIAKLFRSDIRTVILNPLDLDQHGKRKYYQELAAPIKSQLKKASKQLKTSAAEIDAQVKIVIIMNNGLTMTDHDEFQRLATERTRNDTSGIDILIVCGMYYFSDRFDSYAFFRFEDIKIRGKERPDLIQKLRDAWFNKVEQYMTKQIVDLTMKRTKEPIQDLFFELNGIRYVKPPIQWGKPSEFYGEAGRPREDTTGMKHCPPVATVLPIFDDESYNFARRNIVNSTILTGSLREYLVWAENERANSLNPFRPIVLVPITRQELEKIERPFNFAQISQSVLPKFQNSVISTADRATEFSDEPLSLNYILVQVNEIGIDKANDIATISHIMDYPTPMQNFIIKGERMKYDYALMLASAHCLSVNANTVYYYRNEDFKWK